VGVGVSPTLSVVIPIYNESQDQFSETLRALAVALRLSVWREAEVVIVDDGSDSPVSTPVVAGAEVRVIRQDNRGRFEARRVGIDVARGEYVLLLDSRVTLEPDALRWVATQVEEGASAWNGHIVTANRGSPYATFWDVITYAAWGDYLRDPKTTSFGIEDYDRYPKGTTQFLAPRSWLLDALKEFDTLYSDVSLASDDTHLLRPIARRDRIHISPNFASRYHSRESFGPFVRHTFHRGTVFLDGHSRRGSRFRPVVLGALPASLMGAIFAVRHPRAALSALGGLSVAGALFARRQGRPIREAASFGALVPPWAIAYSAGIWRGALMALRSKN
jgi:glycosyltransferase involved in cell wall biosynthesis